MSETKLLDLTNDYIFKRTFGYTESGEVTKILLRDILQDKKIHNKMEYSWKGVQASYIDRCFGTCYNWIAKVYEICEKRETREFKSLVRIFKKSRVENYVKRKWFWKHKQYIRTKMKSKCKAHLDFWWHLLKTSMFEKEFGATFKKML